MNACGKWLVVFGGLRNRACLDDAAALDTEVMVWQALEVEGVRPPARGNHTAVVLSAAAGAHRLWVFGGDAPASGFAPPEAWALQLHLGGGGVCSWSCPQTRGPPPPACCDHAAAACAPACSHPSPSPSPSPSPLTAHHSPLTFHPHPTRCCRRPRESVLPSPAGSTRSNPPFQSGLTPGQPPIGGPQGSPGQRSQAIGSDWVLDLEAKQPSARTMRSFI